MDIVRRILMFATIRTYRVKKCQRGRLVCGSQSDGILLMFMEIFVSALLSGPVTYIFLRKEMYCFRGRKTMAFVSS